MTSELSFCEELLWRASRSDPAAPVFFDCPLSLSIVVRLRNALSHAALEAAINEVLRRHEVLRSTFPIIDGRPTRVRSPVADVRLVQVDLRGFAAGGRSELVQHALALHLARPFDLARGPLVRAALIGLAQDDHVLALTVHHIVFDTWSRRVVALELKELYRAYTAGEPARLQPLAAGYRDYVSWQRAQMATRRGRALLDYWRRTLSSMSDLRLPADGTRGAASTRADSCSFTLRSEDAYRLRVMSRQRRVTVATITLAVLKVFLHRITGADDLSVGVPVSDRRRHEFEGLIGLFTNVVVVRTMVTESMAFVEVVDRVHAALSDAYRYQDMPYGYLLRYIGGQTPLYRVVFNFIPSIPSSAVELAGLQVEPLPLSAQPRSVADLTVHVQNKAGGLACQFVYKADLFSRARAQQFARQFETLVTTVMGAPREPLGRCAMDACPS